MANDELATLTAEVTETNGIIDSAVTLIQGLAARLIALGQNATDLASLKAAVAAEAARLDAKSTELAAAVAANP